MLSSFTWVVLVQSLTLLQLDPAHSAPPLGAVVHVVPIETNGGKTVRAHFMVAAPNPCPDLTGVCAEGEEDCKVHPTTTPFTGTKPGPGWCIRRWQKTIPSNYSATFELGSKVTWDVFIRTEATVRANTTKLNRPPYVALPPPLRAIAGCPHRINLSLLDLDKDPVRCRFARADQGECHGCTQHSFIELNEEKCMLSFSGEASAGQYSVMLMVEDLLPQSKLSSNEDPKPLSSIPVYLSLTVEEASSSGCSAEPVATGQSPLRDTRLTILPYEQVNLTATFTSELESVVEIGVVGPPDLFMSGLITTETMSTKEVTWVCAPNTLPPILPICFSANTISSQSEPRCLWIHQRETMTLPPGTNLECSDTEMTLVLPVITLKNINMENIKLNSPTCPVSYNNTHLTAHIPLTGCGTKRVHVGSVLIYTNTLQSMHSDTMIRRLPSLILPLACHISPVKAQGQYRSIIGEEEQIFGSVSFWLNFSLPDHGPFSSIMQNATFRHLRIPTPTRYALQAVELQRPKRRLFPAAQPQVEQLDLYVMSNYRKGRAELFVENCIWSVTEDLSDPQTLLEQGCVGSSSIVELLTPDKSFKTYRLNISSIEIHGSRMFTECKVHLCMPTLPSHNCPDPCSNFKSTSIMTDWLSTTTYTIRSGAVSLALESLPSSNIPTSAGNQPAATTTPPREGMATASANAPPETKAMTAALIIPTLNIFLQVLLCHWNI
ncbi:uncharacterized protein LOC130403896 [Gadus chalcogrammus]|uniref:uncharacterized protein LOC130403896 n=1 Tax=Gadus chalcogrammus TaxID=1042646 RepID=UPI0024C4E0FF|nr:uncharacterized protein LOC130403896 [Gadus chalcogrammus]XP_056464402.1 uncharacterized protein LOC130403896 [Gadus chalcogrammus]